MDFKSLDALVSTAIQEGVFPGAAYAIGYRGKVVHRKALRRHTYRSESKSTELVTFWNLASVSKVVGTTSGAMILYDEGQLDFERPVAELIPEFGQSGKSAIT